MRPAAPDRHRPQTGAFAEAVLPPEQLRAVNRAIEESAWGAYRTEFYATYDYKSIWEASRPNRK